MGGQCLTSRRVIPVRGILSLGAKGVDLLGQPSDRLIHGDDLSEGGCSLRVTDHEGPPTLVGMAIDPGGGKHSELSRADPLSRGDLQGRSKALCARAHVAGRADR